MSAEKPICHMCGQQGWTYGILLRNGDEFFAICTECTRRAGAKAFKAGKKAPGVIQVGAIVNIGAPPAEPKPLIEVVS